MCGRYVPLNAEELRKMRNSLHGISINIDTEESVLLGESRKEIFPSDRALSLVQDKDGVKLAGGVWGFPSPYGKGVIFNARCESAETKPMFRDLIRGGRCVIPASAFFEWDSAGGTKEKYIISVKGLEFFFMAGLYRYEGGTRQFVILTRNAGDDMSRIHDREPVIMSAERVGGWLSGEDDLVSLSGVYSQLAAVPAAGSSQIAMF